MDETERLPWPVWCVIFAVAFLAVAPLLALIFVLPAMNEDHRRMMQQCMSDGHLEYECRAILSGGRD